MMRPILLFGVISCLVCTEGSVLSMERQKRVVSESSERVRRATDTTCPTSASEHAALKGTTDIHIFSNDSNIALSLTWTGTEGAILAMTSTYYGPTKLYRSDNRGQSFTEISEMIDNSDIDRHNGMVVSPVDSRHVMLVKTGQYFFSYFLDDDAKTVLYITKDSGKTFKKVSLTFDMKPNSLVFNHNEVLDVAALSTQSSDSKLWVSHDFGRTWKYVDDYVVQVRWDPLEADILYYTKDTTKTFSTAGFEKDLYKLRVTSSSSSPVKLSGHVHSFGVQGGYLFMSVEYLNHNGSRVMHVSKNQGASWDAAQIPLIGREQFYSLLDMSEEMVFVHVDTAGEEGNGVIYTSDERGVIYSESLDRHLYPDQESVTDFYKVESLNGVYITSQVNTEKAGGTVHSMITFDKGGIWEKIDAPVGSSCAATEKECKLQIHNLFSKSKRVAVAAFPKSSSSAPGIILVHGNVGDALSFDDPDVYVSNNGGYSWTQPAELKGPHYYGIGDSGGILYAIKAIDATNVVKFSLDEGQCWQEYQFVENEIMVTGISIEPGLKSTLLGIWGWDHIGDSEWRSITVDFAAILKTDCGKSDYEIWNAHETNDKADDACLLGSQVLFNKRKKGRTCKNGKDFETSAVKKPCTCTHADFLCDYGYIRTVKDDCVEKPNHNSFEDICINGTDEEIETHGYRKIPGDTCVGGFHEDPTKFKILKKSCIKYNVSYTYVVTSSSSSSRSTTTTATTVTTTVGNVTKGVKGSGSGLLGNNGSNIGIIVFLALTVLIMVGIIIFLIRRNMTFRQRYSRLVNEVPTHALGSSEANELDTQEEDRATNRLGTSSILYHDDSDEDLLIT